MKRTTLAAVSAAALALTSAVPATGAPSTASSTASAAQAREVVENGLSTPLSLAVGRRVAYVSQNFPGPGQASGTLVRVREGAEPRIVARARPGREIGAVDVRRGVVTYAVSWGENEGGILRRLKGGKARTIGDIGAAERRTNPDRVNRYGFVGLPEDCEVPPGLGRYRGIVETHPYGTARRGRTTYVADAGANAVFAVRRGKVTPVAALPPVRVEVTRKAVKQFGLPRCVTGSTIKLEPVPTDVEVGPDGQLYVTSLPGGPESPVLGANGAVFRIDPASGAVTKVAGGLMSATGLAVARTGDIYVAELFAGRLSKIAAGASEVTASRKAVMPAAVEVRAGWLWATTNVMSGFEGGAPNGKVVRMPRF